MNISYFKGSQNKTIYDNSKNCADHNDEHSGKYETNEKYDKDIKNKNNKNNKISKNQIVNIKILSNWSRAENLVQINLQRILKKYKSDNPEQFVEDLIQVPKPNQKDDFYLYVFKVNFKNPKKSVIILHPFLEIGATPKEIDKKNGNEIIGNAITQTVNILAEDKRPLNLAHIYYDWYSGIKHSIAVLYQPMYSNTHFDKKAPFYFLACGFNIS